MYAYKRATQAKVADLFSPLQGYNIIIHLKSQICPIYVAHILGMVPLSMFPHEIAGSTMTFLSVWVKISLVISHVCHERCTHPLLHGGQYEVKRGFGCIGSGILYRSSDIMEHSVVMRQHSVRYTTSSKQ